MTYSRILHSLSFKLIWVGTIVLAAKGHDIMAALLIWGWSIFWWLQPKLSSYSSLAIKSLLVGTIAELILCYSGIALNKTGEALFFPPLWLLGLWLAFASLLPYCLKGLHQKLAVAAIVGAVFGPLSYNAGSNWGAMHIQSDIWGLSIIGLIWGISFPFLLVQVPLGDKPEAELAG